MASGTETGRAMGMKPHVIVIGRHNSLKRWEKQGWHELSNMHLGGGVFMFTIEKRKFKHGKRKTRTTNTSTSVVETP